MAISTLTFHPAAVLWLVALLLAVGTPAAAQEPPDLGSQKFDLDSSRSTRTVRMPAAQLPSSDSQLVPVAADELTVEASGIGNQPTPLPVAPLTVREKVKHGLRRAFLDPGSYIGPAFGAYFTQRGELEVPAKTRGDEFADGLSRYARDFTTQSTAQVFGAGIYPALFKQDPRYTPSPKRGFASRVLYAASRTVLTQSDAGETQINYSRLAGNLTSAGLANIYERSTPASRDQFGRVLTINDRVGVGRTFINFGQVTAIDAAGYIVFDELDLPGKLGRRVRKLFGGR